MAFFENAIEKEKRMSLFDEAINDIDDANGRDPREFPFCFFLKDDWASGSGMFAWYKSEKELLKALKKILIGYLSQDEDRNLKEARSALSEIIKSITSKPIVGEELHKKLVAYLHEVHSPVRCDYLGSFKELCVGENEWVSELRDYFRCTVLDDYEILSKDETRKPLKSDEIDDFCDHLSNYGY